MGTSVGPVVEPAVLGMHSSYGQIPQTAFVPGPTVHREPMRPVSWLDGSNPQDKPQMGSRCNPSSLPPEEDPGVYGDVRPPVQTPDTVRQESSENSDDKWAEILTCLHSIHRRLHNLEDSIARVHMLQNQTVNNAKRISTPSGAEAWQ
jgi:hypothetical protein